MQVAFAVTIIKLAIAIIAIGIVVDVVAMPEFVSLGAFA